MGGVQWGGGLYTLGIGSDHRDALDGNRGSDFFEAFTPPHPFLVLYTSVCHARIIPVSGEKFTLPSG